MVVDGKKIIKIKNDINEIGTNNNNKMHHGRPYRSALHNNRTRTETPTNKCNPYPSSMLVPS